MVMKLRLADFEEVQGLKFKKEYKFQKLIFYGAKVRKVSYERAASFFNLDRSCCRLVTIVNLEMEIITGRPPVLFF